MYACLLWVFARTQAVVPAPDGGYPGQNTAEGQNALLSLTTGTNNTAVGWFSLKTLTTGQYNTALGSGALFNTATSNLNTATGAAALFRNTSGFNNTAHGALSLFDNTTGDFNTANGYGALSNNTTGFQNTAIGWNALLSNAAGSNNTASGVFAGASITGDGNVCIGANVDGVAGENNSTWIKNINTTLQSFVGGTNNYVTVRMSDGRLGFTSLVSSRRYKEDIKPMDKASETLLALKPVTFRLKGELDPSHRPQWGLIAEEVEKVNPDLVDRNNKGEVESVRYEAVNAMLLNEFLKEHRTVEEQQATITELKSTMAQHQKDVQANCRAPAEANRSAYCWPREGERTA